MLTTTIKQVLPFILGLSLIAPVIARPAHAAPLPSGAAITMVRQYVTDLNNHRYRAAYYLEATCGFDLVARIPGTTQTSSLGFPARPSDARSGTGALHFVRKAHISAIQKVSFSNPVLRRRHVIGVRASGTYRFVYPKNWVPNDQIPSGYHRIVFIVRPCGTRWEIDAGWPFLFRAREHGFYWR